MKRIAFLLIFLLIRSLSYADGYWLELKGSGNLGDTLFILIRYGGVNEQKERYIKTGAELDKMKDFVLSVYDSHGQKHPVPIKQLHDYWIGYFIPSLKGTHRIVAENEGLPVVKRPDSTLNIKPVQYLCTTYRVEGDQTVFLEKQFLDIDVSQKGDTAFIYPFINQQPVPDGTKLRVFLPDNSDRWIVTEKGVALLSTDKNGLYLIRLDWLDQLPGKLETEKYQSTRHRFDYSLRHNLN